MTPQLNILLRSRRESFNPLLLGGVAMWLNARSLQVAGGASAETWTDLSGNGLSPTQATGTKRPLYTENGINGQPALLFDGVDDEMGTAGNSPISGDPEFSLYVVERQSSISGSQCIFMTGTGGATPGTAFSLFPNLRTGDWFDLGWNMSSADYNTNKALTTDPVLIGIRKSAGIIRDATAVTFNGVAATTRNASGNVTPVIVPAPISIGKWPGVGGYHNGPIAEIILFSRRLNAAEDSYVQSNLARIYGLPIS